MLSMLFDSTSKHLVKSFSLSLDTRSNALLEIFSFLQADRWLHFLDSISTSTSDFLQKQIQCILKNCSLVNCSTIFPRRTQNNEVYRPSLSSSTSNHNIIHYDYLTSMPILVICIDHVANSVNDVSLVRMAN